MSLQAPESVQRLQKVLHAKAKEAPELRFYALYDKVYREDVLAFAYRCCKANGGAPGVDGQDFAQIEAYGRERWLGELAETLRNKSYRANAIRRVNIPKPDGGQRPLGIPTVLDRLILQALHQVLSPLFEPEFREHSYGFRPGRSAHQAVLQARQYQ